MSISKIILLLIPIIGLTEPVLPFVESLSNVCQKGTEVNGNSMLFSNSMPKYLFSSFDQIVCNFHTILEQ